MVCGGCARACRRLFCREDATENTVTNNTNVIENPLCDILESKEVVYSEQLHQPLQIGSHIICTGTPTDDHPWFSMNIGTGSLASGRADIAVHFNPRMPQQYVVRNNRNHMDWGREETTGHRSFPFKIGRKFTVEVMIDTLYILFAVDGEHFCGFDHRSPHVLASSWIQISGLPDATLLVSTSEHYPVLTTPRVEVPILKGDDLTSNEEEPHWDVHPVALMSEGIPQGHQLVIEGRLRRLVHSFKLDICKEGGQHEWPRVGVLLHADLRAYDTPTRPRQLLVLNSWNGEWGQERRQRSANVVPGVVFQLRVINTPEQWQVYANDTMVGSMEHRTPPELARALRLRGDLIPHRIYIAPACI